MHSLSPILAAMTARTAARARREGAYSPEAGEMERTILRALRDLSRTRPRLVAFAPRTALKRVLAVPALRKRLAHPLPRFVDVWGQQRR